MKKKDILVFVIAIIGLLISAIVTWQAEDGEIFCLGIVGAAVSAAVALIAGDHNKES